MMLPARWSALRYHAVQQAFYASAHRFNVVPAGRRSGKTELAKRRLVKRAVRGSDFDRPRFFYGAPTRDQAKRIAWEDLKRLVPPEAMTDVPSETELSIPMWHGGELCVVGLDKPQRIEGSPWDGGVLDEYANMKAQAWGENIRPALSDRRGWCDLIGVPEGRNHYYDTGERAQAELLARGEASEWGYFHWVSADILPPEEIAAAKRDLDPLTFQQEYEASFVNFHGRAYYAFSDANKAAVRALYHPMKPLVFGFDFNVSPGVAVIAQEMRLPNGQEGTAILGEVWIDTGSNTPAVCRRLLADWGPHQGRIEVFGDPAGGARGTAQTAGSDWELVRQILRSGDQEFRGFGDRVAYYVKPSDPGQRARINAVNARCETADGTRRLVVDPLHAPHVVRDLEGVRLLDGGAGELDKRSDPKLSHISDALAYYLEYRFPVTGGRSGSVRVIY